MARSGNFNSRMNRTTFTTSGYRGGRQAMSTSMGGKLGRDGKYISRRQQYGDVRKGLGLNGG
jgi:hypothetical protein